MSGSYRKKRYLVYVLASILLFTLPFVTINDHHILLISFMHGEFHFLGTRFNMQELYLMPFLSIILFVGIFFMTTLAGRVWCGWMCPQTIFRVFYRDLLQTKIFGLHKSIANKQKPLNLHNATDYVKAIIANVIVVICCLLASANLMFFFNPPLEFIESIQNPSQHMVLMIFWLGFGLFFAFDIIYIKERFCIYICPYSRVQSVLYDNDTIMAIYDEGRGGAVYKHENNVFTKLEGKLKFRDVSAECIECEQCVKVCPTHIDIRRGIQLECINCLECVDACTFVMGKQGKKSLVNWSSSAAILSKGRVKFLRPKTIAYMVILLLTFMFIAIFGLHKESALMNINTTNELYKIKDINKIDNSFKLLIHNTDSIPHEFNLIIDSAPEAIRGHIEIISPKKPFVIKSNQKYIQVMNIRVSGELADVKEKNYPIRIKAYALDDENIFVVRKTIFIYPSKAHIEQYLDRVDKSE